MANDEDLQKRSAARTRRLFGLWFLPFSKRTSRMSGDERGRAQYEINRFAASAAAALMAEVQAAPLDRRG